MTRKNAKPPTKAQQQHANKISHRAVDGTFKPAPHKPLPESVKQQLPPLTEGVLAHVRKNRKPSQPELDQDAGSGFRPDRSDIQD